MQGVDNSDASHSSDEERDGRFHGPDNSWRFYTRDERELATSLDQIENNDLSAHLYNTHRLKRRLYSDSSTVRPWQSKRNWFARDETGQIPFHPDRAWTAWPLEPADVPRSGEQWGVPVTDQDEENATYRRKEDWRPSLYLHDSMQAEILRQAKERFRERTFPGQQFAQVVHINSSAQRTSSVSSVEDSDGSSLSSESITQGQEPTEHKSEGTDLQPCFTADEDFAADILRPTVCHIISKLDDILLGLHRSRRGHHRDQSRSRTRSPASRSASRAARKRLSADLPPQEQGHSPRSTSQARDAPKPDPIAKQTSHRSSSRDRPRRQELGTRDWSEVLGVASLVGWDQSIIARAANRCAALFDESMTFRDIPAASIGKARDSDVEPQQLPVIVPSLEQVDHDPLAPEGPVSDGHYCPHASCARHLEPYAQLWRLREHLKRKHKHTSVDIRDMVGKAARPASRSSSTLVDNDYQDRDHQQLGEISLPPGGTECAEYLQPVLINIGRSKDRRVRRTPSREHLKKVNVAQHVSLGGEETIG